MATPSSTLAVLGVAAPLGQQNPRLETRSSTDPHPAPRPWGKGDIALGTVSKALGKVMAYN